MDLSDLRRIAGSASNILQKVSQLPNLPSPLKTTGRHPDLRIPVLSDDVRERLVSQLDSPRLDAVEALLRTCMYRCRVQVLESYRGCVEDMESLESAGLLDHEVESRIIEMFEAAYWQHWGKVSSLVIQKVHAHTQPPSKEKVNDFTQVRPLHPPPILASKLTNPANDHNTRYCFHIHPNSNQRRD